ncbi:putative Ig domain-containing protein [Geothrix sp. PMB-07]|nr:putative Ig domain-containing protein [Geothrix sp. PMB-07]
MQGCGSGRSSGATSSPALEPPTGLSYPQASITAVVGTPLAADVPVVQGQVVSYSIAPDLPRDLHLNTSTGVIAGTPAAPAPPTVYTVTAKNGAGATTTTVTLSVSQPVLQVFSLNFSQDPVGLYGPSIVSTDWNRPPWADGPDQGFLSVVEGAESYEGGRSLKIWYPAGQFGTAGPGGAGGGGVWNTQFGAGGALQSFEELYVAYRVKFQSGFDFVKEGKMRGLAGGARNDGGHKPNDSDGFSVRLIWKAGGQLKEYVYHPDQAGVYGDELAWMVNGAPVVFTPGTWYWIEHRVKMNAPGQHDGIVQGWIDGKLAFDRRDFRFRDTPAFGIDAFQFSTFFGGSDATYATKKEEAAFNDDFVVSTGPISH